jgi:carboxymethylenebutenolidase
MQITLPSGTPAELVRPAEGSPSQGLVLIPDIAGLRPLFVEHAQRIADAQGWAVCSFELWPGREELTLPERLEQAGTLADDEVMADALFAADACGVEPVGVMGFCIGGMYTLKAAGMGRFERAAAFYGHIRVPEAWRSPDQGEPLDFLADPGACPTMAIVGTEDHYTPPADVEDLAAAGVTVVSYEGAEHGFVHDPSRPTHRPDDAADAWDHALTFLGQAQAEP